MTLKIQTGKSNANSRRKSAKQSVLTTESAPVELSTIGRTLMNQPLLTQTDIFQMQGTIGNMATSGLLV